MSSQEPLQKYPGPPAASNNPPPSPGDAPKNVASKVGDKVANTTGVTSSGVAPGKPAAPAGTTFPVADLANPKAKNAGVEAEAEKKIVCHHVHLPSILLTISRLLLKSPLKSLLPIPKRSLNRNLTALLKL